MNIADRKSGAFLALTGQAVENLPELLDALPPAISDVFDHERRPNYDDKIHIEARLAEGREETRREHGNVYPVLTIQNSGDEVVSWLTLRVVVFDRKDDPIGERVVIAATPIALEGGMSGPMLPGARRVISGCRHAHGHGLPDSAERVDVEITDVRIWTPKTADGASDPPSQSREQ